MLARKRARLIARVSLKEINCSETGTALL